MSLSNSLKAWLLQRKKGVTVFVSIVVITTIVLGISLGNSRNDNTVDVVKPVSLYSGSELSYFDSSIVSGYSKCEDLTKDLEAAAKLIVDVRVDLNAKGKFREEWYSGWLPRGGWRVEVLNGEGPVFTVEEGATENKGQVGGGSGGGENSFGTNNQVDGVEEADLIKSDGEVVYAAYGDKVVIWNANTGVELSRTTLPTEDGNGRISSLLIHEKRLVAISSLPSYMRPFDGNRILNGYHSTSIFTYDISSIPTDKSPLPLLARKDLQGSYQTARSIDNVAHIVTNSYVTTWDHLDYIISPWLKQYDGMDENEYRQAAYDNVLPAITKFSRKLTEEILYSHGIDYDVASEDDCAQIAKVASMLHQNQNKMSSNGIPSFTTEGVLNNYVQVHSIDIQENFTNETITTSHSGVFLPTASYTSSIYSSETKLIISGNAYREDPSSNQWKERTVLFAFDLSSGKAVADSVGEVPGSVLNQFSMDHHKYDNDGEDYIRVATTTWAQFGIVDDTWTQTEESTNQVTILKLPSKESTSTDMEVVGVVDGMGIGERIYAARFIEKEAFVVTFRQIDPFYTLDLSDPSNPAVVGELKIPGFSNYLHPVSDTLILALGQDADDMGRTQGLQIAMFDVSDLSNPKQTHKYVEEGFSSSDAQFDHKAFRYLPMSKLLIVPMTIYASENDFDGFVVYDVDENKDEFSESFTISHKEDVSTFDCWDDSDLPSRSLVFDGKVTTTKRHTAMSHDLTTFEKLWTLNLDAGRDKKVDDCWYWTGPVILF